MANTRPHTVRRNKEVREKEEKEKIEAGVDKNANMKLCFSTDSTQTPAQRELLGSTSLTPELLKALSDRLHKACSGDELDKETFVREVSQCVLIHLLTFTPSIKNISQ